MTALTRYDAARNALLAAARVEDVKDIRDKAVALQEYARQARDCELIEHATEIRLRAERRAGEMLRDMAESGERAKGGGDLRKESPGITLSAIGVTKHQSSRWQGLAGLDEAVFEQRVDATKRLVVASLEGSKAKRTVEKQRARGEREAALGAAQIALPAKQYGVILADPEWRFEVYARETGMDRSPDNHYPTSPTEAIMARDVGSIAASDCVLFLWATAPMLPDALRVMDAWGFVYKSHVVWNKNRAGTGYWFRNRHELLLVGVRGDIPAPAMGTQAESVIAAPVGAHSAKPELFLELIERHFPTLPKIELNRRGPARAGWDAWGTEATGTEASHG